MDATGFWASTQPLLISFGLKLLGAIAIVIIGRWLIRLISKMITKAMEKQRVEPTIVRYLSNTLTVGLNVLLFIGILGFFGVETTSFAALIAALGIAIGAAWGGLLSNFAAGAFILVLRPFKVGDYVLAGEVEGTVRSIGLFNTTIDSPDNVLTSVGNGAIMRGTIKNFTHNPYRRVDLTAQLDHTVDPRDAILRLKSALPKIDNVLATPQPDVEIMAFTERGPLLAVRPYVHNDHYWQVYFDTNRVIRDTFGTAGYPVPEAHVQLRQLKAA